MTVYVCAPYQYILLVIKVSTNFEQCPDIPYYAYLRPSNLI